MLVRLLVVGPAVVLFLAAAFAASPNDLSPEYGGFFPGSYGDGIYTSRWFSRWPVKNVLLETPRLRTTMSTQGVIGAKFRHPFLDTSHQYLDFPMESSAHMLTNAHFVFGGILNGDTLVSNCGTYKYNWYLTTELYPPQDPVGASNLFPENAGWGETFRTALVDTFTWAHFSHSGIWGHRPLGIEVTVKAHTCSDPSTQNIILLDVTAKNIGGDMIEEAFVGLEVIPYIGTDSGGAYGDELVGGFRGEGAVYAIDNDGDPVSRRFIHGQSATDALGVMIAGLSHPSRDTAFNWWDTRILQGGDTALQPMSRQEYRDFGTISFDWYWDDPDYYHLLRNDEWDYDQCFANSIGPDDPVWEQPNGQISTDVANGGSVRLVLSAGPYDLAPDSSVRAVYALFGAEAVHVDPANGLLLDEERYQRYRENLQFDIYRRRLDEVRAMVDRYTGPDTPPADFHVTYLSNDTVEFSWDPHLFNNTDGLLIELSRVAERDFVGCGQVRPEPEFGPVVRSHFVPAGRSSTTVTGLTPGTFYLSRIRHQSTAGPGRPSVPIVVGYGNKPLTPAPVEIGSDYVFVQNSELTALTWEPSGDPAIDFYRIFRSTDSNLIQWRHKPFFAVDSALVPQFPLHGDTTASGIPWFYYAMKPHDSVPAAQPGYVDSGTVLPAWYCVTAVNHYGYESAPSRTITTVVGEPAERDILVIYGDTENFHDYVREDSLVAFYERLLAGYDYDLYNFADTNRNIHSETEFEYLTRWQDLSRYRLIIIDDFPEPTISIDLIEDTYTTMQRIVASGRDLLYFSVPAGHNDLHLGSHDELLSYRDESFVSRYLHLDSAEVRLWRSYERFDAVDSLAGFVGATPADENLPDLPVDLESVRTTEPFAQLFELGECLPMTGVFYPDSTAEVLYRYRSAYPTTSELQGKPCGIVARHAAANAYTFSFHLWSIEESAARELIDYALDNQIPDTEFHPPLLPVGFSLYPNYPNPFNPTTTIRYNLNTGSHVLLEVFNILGRKVARLVDAYRTPGLYSVQWNGRTDRGAPAASGVYLYRIETSLGRDSRKMLLVR